MAWRLHVSESISVAEFDASHRQTARVADADRRILRLDQLRDTVHVPDKPAITKFRQIHLGGDRTSIAAVPEIGEVDRQEEAIVTPDGDTEQSVAA